MVKYGALTSPVRNVLNEIKLFHELGFDYVEIGIEGPEGSCEKILRDRKKILALLKRYKMFAVGHTSWWIELGSPYEVVRKAWVEESKRTIDVAAALNIGKITFHSHSRGAYTRKKKYKKLVFNAFMKSLKELVEYGKKKGVKVMLENAASGKEIKDFEDYKYIVKGVKNLKVHVDVGHAFINGGMETVKKFITSFKDRLEHIHIHDNHGEEDEHLPLGVAELEYEKVVKLLKKVGYNKTVTFEVFTRDDDFVRDSRERFDNVWKSRR